MILPGTGPLRRSIEGTAANPVRESVQAGFALILVLWSIGLVALIATTILVSEAYRIRATANRVENAKAEALAFAAIDLTRDALAGLSAGGEMIAGTVKLCGMPDGSGAAIAVELESGKVDINTARPELLSVFLRGFGATQAEALQLMASISDFTRRSGGQLRSAELADRRSAGGSSAKGAAFETVVELDQVGFPPGLLEAVLPHLTVHSQLEGVDERFVSPVLAHVLAGGQVLGAASPSARAGSASIPLPFRSTTAYQAFLIHAEILTSAGGVASRQAIVELTAENPPDVLREWRSAPARHSVALRGAGSAALPNC